ncbi:hypothetical protein [Rossellomorea aquimaris]|uniref:hypothetical protein n=1 Tax=Rossellomorea aquimaris TaxID=189382 RepID=UPI001CFF38D1|nr:hypothetical protein [Rossellomorea aquimaris]
MKINAYLIRLSFSIMLIFGGTFGMYYVKTGDLLVYNLIATCVGILLLLASWIWRIKNKSRVGEMV